MEPASPPEETALSEKPTVETGLAPSVDQGERLEASLPAEKVEAQARDETSFTLQPGAGAEIKADLLKNGKLAYFWTANGGVVNVDFHGEPHSNSKDSTLNRKDRDIAQDEGVFEAPNDGIHGWFWRNRMTEPVTVTLITSGDYREIKRLK